MSNQADEVQLELLHQTRVQGRQQLIPVRFAKRGNDRQAAGTDPQQSPATNLQIDHANRCRALDEVEAYGLDVAAQHQVGRVATFHGQALQSRATVGPDVEELRRSHSQFERQ